MEIKVLREKHCQSTDSVMDTLMEKEQRQQEETVSKQYSFPQLMMLRHL